MCLIAIAWRCHPRYRLALIANRDEYHSRPAAPAGPDPELPCVYGGRDLQQGGSWLMVSRRRRLAAVTNVRAGPAAEPMPRSRGALVRGFAGGDQPAAGWLQRLADDAGDYGRFNLLAWDGEALVFASNHPDYLGHPVEPGLHAMSNGAFDASWPKSTHATRALAAWLASHATTADDADPAPLLAALADETLPADAELPDTGIGLELERTLSPPFVRGEHYGTRCSTVVLADDAGVRFVERRFDAEGRIAGDSDEWLAWR